MAEVDQHAEAVHLVHDDASEVVEAVPLGIVGRAVGEFVVLEVGQRHVASAEVVELAKRGEAAADLVTALDPDQRGDFSRLVDAHDVVGGPRQLEVARIGFHHSIDGIDLLERRADRRIAGHFGRDVDRPELPADTALVKPRHVGHQRMVRPTVGAAREALDAEIVILAQLFGDVVVAVDQRRALEDSIDPRLDVRRDRLGGSSGGHEGQGCCEEERVFEVHGARV